MKDEDIKVGERYEYTSKAKKGIGVVTSEQPGLKGSHWRLRDDKNEWFVSVRASQILRRRPLAAGDAPKTKRKANAPDAASVEATPAPAAT